MADEKSKGPEADRRAAAADALAADAARKEESKKIEIPTEFKPKYFRPIETDSDVLPGKYKESMFPMVAAFPPRHPLLWKSDPTAKIDPPAVPINKDILGRLSSLQVQGATGEWSRQPTISRIEPGSQSIAVNSIGDIVDLGTLTPEQRESIKLGRKLRITNGLEPHDPKYGEIFLEELPPEEREVPLGWEKPRGIS